MTTINVNDISSFQLLVWKSGLKLEKLGMTRRGPSVKKITQAHFNMPKATCDQLIDRINQELSK